MSPPPPRTAVLIAATPTLAATPGGTAWAQGVLAAAFAGLPAGRVVLTAAEDPVGAWVAAAAGGCGVVTYAVAGARAIDGVVEGAWEVPAAPPGTPPAVLRNLALVEGLLRAQAAGYAARALVLVDPALGAGAGAATSRLRAAGIPVEAKLFEPDAVAPDWDAVVPRAGRDVGADVVWVDIETSGLGASAQIIELAFVHTDGQGRRAYGRWSSRIALEPGVVVGAEAARVNGYRPELWAYAPPLEAAMADFVVRLPPRFVLGGHNVAFDRGHIGRTLYQLELPEPGWAAATHDTMKLARKLLRKPRDVPNHKLSSVCAFLGLSNLYAHTALGDCERARAVFRRLMFPDQSNELE